jgi:Homeodomain-like domain
MARKYAVHLSDHQREQLSRLIRGGSDERRTTLARLLLMAADGATDGQIARDLHVAPTAIRRARKLCVESGPDAALGAPPGRAASARRNGPPAPQPPPPSPPPAQFSRPPAQPPMPNCGIQFTGTLAAGSTRRWFTHGWPVAWTVAWTVIPTTIHPGAAEVTWSVAVQRAGAESVTYWITVTNLTNVPITVEGRYAILGRS